MGTRIISNEERDREKSRDNDDLVKVHDGKDEDGKDTQCRWNVRTSGAGGA